MDEIPRDQLSGPLRRAAVKKHVAAIHVSGKLTLLQRKLSNVLLLNAYDTLTNIYKLWRRPVHVKTVLDDTVTVLSFDGSEPTMTPTDEKVQVEEM